MKLLIKNFFTPELNKMKEMFGEPGESYNFNQKTGQFKGLKHFKLIRWGVGNRYGNDLVVFFRHKEDMLLAAIQFETEVIESEIK